MTTDELRAEYEKRKKAASAKDNHGRESVLIAWVKELDALVVARTTEAEDAARNLAAMNEAHKNLDEQLSAAKTGTGEAQELRARVQLLETEQTTLRNDAAVAGSKARAAEPVLKAARKVAEQCPAADASAQERLRREVADHDRVLGITA